MGSLSIWHWMIAIFWLSIIIVPGWRIASKAGYSGAFSLLLLVPVLNLIMVWVFAFSQWPNQREKA